MHGGNYRGRSKGGNYQVEITGGKSPGENHRGSSPGSIWRALVKADVPSSKEPTGLIRNDGKRPDRDTLIPRARGKYIHVRRLCCYRHPYMRRLLHLTSVASGGAAENGHAAEHAADRKCTTLAFL